MAHLDYNISSESDVIPKEPSYPPPGVQKLLDSIPTAYGVVVSTEIDRQLYNFK